MGMVNKFAWSKLIAARMEATRRLNDARAVKRKISDEVAIAFPDQNKKQRRQTAKDRFESTLLHEYHASLELAFRDD